MSKNEAFSRILIDSQLTNIGWNLADTVSVRFEYPLPDGTRLVSKKWDAAKLEWGEAKFIKPTARNLLVQPLPGH